MAKPFVYPSLHYHNHFIRAIGVPVCQALMKTQNPGSCKSAKYLVWCGYPGESKSTTFIEAT